jgi:hypothetical protein
MTLDTVQAGKAEYENPVKNEIFVLFPPFTFPVPVAIIRVPLLALQSVNEWYVTVSAATVCTPK